MRIATWNVNSITARLPRVLPWLAETQPDVLCMQETKVDDARFPFDAFTEAGYEAAHFGSGRYNGVALLSRAGLEDVVRGFAGEPGFPDPEPRAIAATCGGVRVWSVYIPNGREVDSPAFAYKMAWLEAIRTVVAADATRPLAICGDFNVAPTDDDVWDPAAFVGSTHVTPGERAAIAALVDLGLTDPRPRIAKGRPFTYWDYRAGNFHKGMGMRIDLTLLSPALAAGVEDVWVDREARKGTAPSDHAPVVVDVAVPALA